MVRRSGIYKSIGNGDNVGGRRNSNGRGNQQIKVETLHSYNKTVTEAIIMVPHLRISLCPVKMVQLALYNATTSMNGDTFQIISLKFLLIVSMVEAADVVEVHELAEYQVLYCYISALVLIRTLI